MCDSAVSYDSDFHYLLVFHYRLEWTALYKQYEYLLRIITVIGIYLHGMEKYVMEDCE